MKTFNEITVAKSLLYGGVLLLSLSSLLMFTYMRVPESTEIEDVSASVVAPPNQDPAFGAVYKEIKLKWPDTNKQWRVTNPNAAREEARAFLPNPTLPFSVITYAQEPFTITEEDLNDDVQKVEIIIDRWGGHKGTKDEKFRLNGGTWYNIPEVPTLPDVETKDYLHHDNPKIVINKEEITTGNNILEGTTGHSSPSGWGQWGWTSVLIRIYYNENTRDVVKGTVNITDTFSDNPIVKTNIVPAEGVTASKVDYIGYYEGVDEDGDGYTTDWHEAYFSPKQIQEGESFKVTNHIGTSSAQSDFPTTWDTKYVPDQAADSIKIIARIKSSNGLTYITQPKTGLTLNRPNSSVKIYHAQNVPPNFSSRKSNIVDVVRVRIPSSIQIDEISEAVMFWRTWNGHQYQWGYNSYTTTFNAVNHGFHQSYYTVPNTALIAGNGANDGKVWINGDTDDHALEALWPGPALIIRMGTVPPTLTPTEDVESTATPTPSPTPTEEVINSPTPTPTDDPLVTPSATPEFSPTPSPTTEPEFSPTPTEEDVFETPTPTFITGNICGKSDINNDGVFTLVDFSAYALVYKTGTSTCDDVDVDYGVCGGRDIDRNGILQFYDFGAETVGFAQRYYPKSTCSLN